MSESSERKRRNSARINLIVSVVFHSVLIGGITYLAAKEGMLGKTLKTKTATLENKVKKPDPVKPPEPPKQAETPKVAQNKPAEPTAKPDTSPNPPPRSDSGPVSVAPAAAIASDVEIYTDKEVVTSADPNTIYKASVERTLRANWNRPEDLADENFVAQVELSLDPTGKILNSQWIQGSGNDRWDSSVRKALAATKAVGNRPKGFPDKFTVKFDVESRQTEDTIDVSVQ